MGSAKADAGKWVIIVSGDIKKHHNSGSRLSG